MGWREEEHGTTSGVITAINKVAGTLAVKKLLESRTACIPRFYSHTFATEINFQSANYLENLELLSVYSNGKNVNYNCN